MTTVKELTTINCLKRGFRIDATGRANLLQLTVGLYTKCMKRPTETRPRDKTRIRHAQTYKSNYYVQELGMRKVVNIREKEVNRHKKAQEVHTINLRSICKNKN